jgi:hypothetical protein
MKENLMHEKSRNGVYLMTWGSSASKGWCRIGVDEKVEA